MNAKLARVLMLLALLTSPRLASAEQITRLVMPFAAGSSTDAIARIIADEIGPGLGSPVIVENKTGAAGRLGVQAVKGAAPDGTTLLFTPIAPMAIYQHVYPNLGYDPVQDFAPVSQVARFDFAVAVTTNVPATSLADLVSWLEAHPEKGNYGTPGAGTLPHFFAVLFGRESGLDLRHVPYRGASAAVNDLLAGNLSMVFANTGELLALHQAGRVRILATSGKTRSPFLPDVPTFKESGYPIAGAGWLGIFAPRGTPPARVARISGLVTAVLGKDDVKARIAAMGFEPTGTSAERLAAILREDAATWAPAVKAAHFTPDQ